MKPEDLFRIRWISDARIAPDGSRVAFTVATLDEAADDYRSSIWLVDTAGGAPVQFSRGPGRDSSPRWSPDGRRLAFLSDRDSRGAQLYVIELSGGEPRKLTSLPEGASSPVWSPDGSRLVVVARTPVESEQDAKPKNPPARVITIIKYRANGEGFIYDRRKHLFTVDARSAETCQLTDGDWDDVQPCWSPDGSRIAFVSARHDLRDSDHALDIFVVSAAGGVPQRLTPGGGHAALPAWSSDGTAIAYLGYADAEDAPRNSRLLLVSAAGGEPRWISDGCDRQFEAFETAAPIWSADNSAIYAAFQDRGATGIARVEVEHATVEPLATGQATISSYDLDRSGKSIVWTASDPVHPAELRLSVEGQTRSLTNLNAVWREEVSLPAAQHFTVESDGGEIDVWIMPPAVSEPGRRYPTLLNIHGGPFGQYGWAFLDEFQVEAGAGYAVVCCNPRGSSGRDDEFARAILGAPGEPDSADLLRVVKAAVQRFDFIDPDRVGVIGGSYGGYLTSWLIGHTNRFVAACSERALNNRYSKEGTSDISSGFTYLRVRQWEDPDLYRRFSPITYVRDIHTPVLILHSEEDIRCPIEQGEQLFVALKQLGREAVFVRFPGENHDLSRSGKPSHRVQRFQHILHWFEAHLG